MPRGPYLSGKDEYRGSFCLVPSGSNGGTVVYFDVSQQLNVGHDRGVQIVSGRIGDVRSRIEGAELPFVQLKGKDLELFMFDPLRLQLEEYPPDTLRGVSWSHLANFNRRSNSVDAYHQYRIAMQRFSQITSRGATKPICPEPHCASVFFPERELLDDRGVACIVLEAWQYESVREDVQLLPAADAIVLAERAEDTMRAFMELGWHVNGLEEFLFINKLNGDMIIDIEALSRAYMSEIPVDTRIELPLQQLKRVIRR